MIANKAAAKKGPDAADNHDLFRSTYGLMFFGVPNLGLRHRELITMVGEQPNQRLITDLVVDRDSEASPYLAELKDKFIEACAHSIFEIISYYERELSSTVEVSDCPFVVMGKRLMAFPSYCKMEVWSRPARRSCW